MVLIAAASMAQRGPARGRRATSSSPVAGAAVLRASGSLSAGTAIPSYFFCALTIVLAPAVRCMPSPTRMP